MKTKPLTKKIPAGILGDPKHMPDKVSVPRKKLKLFRKKIKFFISKSDIQAKEIRLSDLTTTKETTTNDFCNCWDLVDKLMLP